MYRQSANITFIKEIKRPWVNFILNRKKFIMQNILVSWCKRYSLFRVAFTKGAFSPFPLCSSHKIWKLSSQTRSITSIKRCKMTNSMLKINDCSVITFSFCYSKNKFTKMNFHKFLANF